MITFAIKRETKVGRILDLGKFSGIDFQYKVSFLQFSCTPTALSDPHWNDFIVEEYYFTKTPMGVHIQQKLEVLIYRRGF